ncbi:hypothetical protein B296_00008974 [Ensete ventricosum]|uniref:Uncharacterized protein n=1 Tax=Ensete ventricosum TaxID=4639 RepID=A0A426ZZU8_ENSVE|nr:hypothetical protein B296_00008974 [Ensete ventricosum]
MKRVQAGVERFLPSLAVSASRESAQRDSGREYKRDPMQAVRSQRVLMLGSGCHFNAGSSADLAELSLQDKTFTWVVDSQGGPFDDQVRVVSKGEVRRLLLGR